jgi:hypothetical protein
MLSANIDWGPLLYLDQQVVKLCPLRCDVDKGCRSVGRVQAVCINAAICHEARPRSDHASV